MDENNEQQVPPGFKVIQLNGTHGMGVNILLSILTKDAVSGERTETFRFPMILLTKKASSYLDNAMTAKLIMGYKIERLDEAEAVANG